jgi:hypothetical protein
MRGTPEMSVVRMTVRITSRTAAEKVEYILSYPDDVHIPGPSHSMYAELESLGADGVFYDPRDHSLHFTLWTDGDLRHACKAAAGYLRWLHDFGGGVEFTYTCPHCRHEEAFIL